jgi:DNA-binding SARP family transcriptional activator/pimeloyl-ACP methyl ester carboxylesterase
MKFQVLGGVRAYADDGAPVALGNRRRALLACLLSRAGEIVPVDLLVDILWRERSPVDPAGALHTQVSRLRRALPGLHLSTEPPGYVLRVDPEQVDAGRFDRLATAARKGTAREVVGLLEEALGLWRGRAYGEFADTEVARLEAIRLEETRLHAIEAWHDAMLASGQAARSLPRLEAFVAEHPLREQARTTLMRTLYAVNRHAEALTCYQQYADRLADELGLEPSAAIQQTRLHILRRDLLGANSNPVDPPVPFPLSALQPRYITTADGHGVALATIGQGPPLVVLPAWVTSIDVIASGRDPRSSLLQRLAAHTTVTIYDRYGTGLSPGEVTAFGLRASVDELHAVVRHVGTPVNLLAISQAGPVAIALAAERPDLVDRLVLFGTYASASTTFTNPDLNATLVAMVRSHWGLGSKLFAELYRPDASTDAAQHLAAVLRDSAGREVAASYLDAVYRMEVADLLAQVAAPTLVMHYRGDRVIPFAGGLQLATELPGARLVTLDGRYHLPDAADLDRAVSAIATFLAEPVAAHTSRA